jgi:hypothetical protein
MGNKEKAMQKNTARPLAVGLVVVAALARMAQNLNFAPVGALALFAGARLRGWKAYALPIALMAVTDPFLRGYSVATPLVYASLLVYVWIGSRLRGSENPVLIGSASLAGSIQFFLVTNFAWLAGSNMYPHTLAGVLACYNAGVPFFWRTMGSDLLYSGVLFGLHAWLSRTVAPRERVAVAVAA